MAPLSFPEYELPKGGISNFSLSLQVLAQPTLTLSHFEKQKTQNSSYERKTKPTLRSRNTLRAPQKIEKKVEAREKCYQIENL